MNNPAIKIETSRLVIRLSGNAEMEAIVRREKDGGLKVVYAEMLENCLRHPEAREWHALWLISLKDTPDTLVGSMAFKGLSAEGRAEIGYGIEDGFRGNGYAAEAVAALTRWAAVRPGVVSIEAETEPDNLASQKVLGKAGFVPNGKNGGEGPRFVWKREN